MRCLTEAFGEVDRSGLLVAFGVRLARLHVDLLKPCVVEVRLRLGRHGDAELVNVGAAEHGVEGVGAAAAPACAQRCTG